MVLTKKERKSTSDAPVEIGEREKYPWGLRISLETAELKKLGLNPQEFKIGAKMIIDAEATISNISLDQNDDGNRKSMSLQIVKMDISESA